MLYQRTFALFGPGTDRARGRLRSAYSGGMKADEWFDLWMNLLTIAGTALSVYVGARFAFRHARLQDKHARRTDAVRQALHDAHRARQLLTNAYTNSREPDRRSFVAEQTKEAVFALEAIWPVSWQLAEETQLAAHHAWFFAHDAMRHVSEDGMSSERYRQAPTVIGYALVVVRQLVESLTQMAKGQRPNFVKLPEVVDLSRSVEEVLAEARARGRLQERSLDDVLAEAPEKGEAT